MEDVKKHNRAYCEAVSVVAMGAWYEGEEGWGTENDGNNILTGLVYE